MDKKLRIRNNVGSFRQGRGGPGIPVRNVIEQSAHLQSLARPGTIFSSTQELLEPTLSTSQGPFQSGNSIQKLPDVVFQPESGIPVTQRLNNFLCFSQLLNAPLGTWITAIALEVSPLQKFVIKDAKLIFTNPYVLSYVQARLTIDSIPKFGFEPRMQQMCLCDPGLTRVAYETQRIKFQIARFLDSHFTEEWDAYIQGWIVPDKQPTDRRGGK